MARRRGLYSSAWCWIYHRTIMLPLILLSVVSVALGKIRWQTGWFVRGGFFLAFVFLLVLLFLFYLLLILFCNPILAVPVVLFVLLTLLFLLMLSTVVFHPFRSLCIPALCSKLPLCTFRSQFSSDNQLYESARLFLSSKVSQ